MSCSICNRSLGDKVKLGVISALGMTFRGTSTFRPVSSDFASSELETRSLLVDSLAAALAVASFCACN